jgi:hypothetical protein
VDERRLRSVCAACLLAVGGVFAVLGVMLAVTFGYRSYDALAFGEWSRLIAETGDLYAGGPGAVWLHRPLFYVTQGGLWYLFGFHEWIGRLLSLSFAVLLAGSVFVLGRRAGRDLLDGALALGVLLVSSVFAIQALSGLSDVPAAATVGAAGVLVFGHRVGRGRQVSIAIAAAVAVLAKPTTVVPLLALACAAALGDRAAVRGRVTLRVAPLLLGTAVGLAWDWYQARRIGMSLPGFMREGAGGYWSELADARRWDTLASMDWLGPGARALLVFGLVYGVLRTVGAPHRPTAWAAAASAALWWVIGPYLATREWTYYPFDDASTLSLAAQIVLVLVLFAAPFAPDELAPSRLWCARLTVWAAPGVIVWLAFRPDDPRLLGSAWAPLVVLIAASFGTVVRGAAAFRPSLLLAPAAALAVLAMADLASVDGIPRDTWREIRQAGILAWFDHDRMAGVGHSPFDDEVEAVKRHAGEDGRISSFDGRLNYHFPGRVESGFPTTCADLRQFRVLVLQQSDEARRFAADAGAPADPTDWLMCTNPRVHAVRAQEGEYAAFVIGTPPDPMPTPDSCRVDVHPGQDLDAVFGADLTLPEARELRARAARGGYVTSRVERTGCNEFKVVVTGVGGDLDDFRAEAASIGLRPEIGPPLRGVEVAPEGSAP